MLYHHNFIMLLYLLFFEIVSSLNHHPISLSEYFRSGVHILSSFTSNTQSFSINLQQAFQQKPKIAIGISGLEMSLNYLKGNSDSNFQNLYGDNFEILVDLNSIEKNSLTLTMFQSAGNFRSISISYIAISVEITFIHVQFLKKLNVQTIPYNQRKQISYQQTFSSGNQYPSSNSLLLLPFLNAISISGNPYLDPIQNINYTWPLEVKITASFINYTTYFFNISIFSSTISKISCHILVIDSNLINSYPTISFIVGYGYSNNIVIQNFASFHISDHYFELFGLNTLVFSGLPQNIKFNNLDYLINIEQINITYFAITGKICLGDSPYLYQQNNMCYHSCQINSTNPNLCVSACNYACSQCTDPSINPNQCTKCSDTAKRIFDNINLKCNCNDVYLDMGEQECKIPLQRYKIVLIVGIVVPLSIILILLIIYGIYICINRKNKIVNENILKNGEPVIQISHDRTINTFTPKISQEKSGQKANQVSL